MKIKSFVINLPSRTDRRESVIAQLKKVPYIDCTIVDAELDAIPWKGCFKSHQKYIAQAKLYNYEYILMMEDDVEFVDVSTNHVLDSLEYLNFKEWHMLYLGANIVAPVTRVTDYLVQLHGAHTTHAYIVHKNFYDVILNLEIDRPIDVYYEKLMSQYKMFMCDPMVAYQTPSHSDIEGGFRDYRRLLDDRYKTNIR